MSAITLFDAAQQVREHLGEIDPDTANQKPSVRKIRIDMTGQTHGELTVLSFSHVSRSKTAHWLVRCSCGIEKIVNGSDLRAGKIVSCGHVKRTRGAVTQYKHGHARRGAHTRTYFIWRNMLTRCYDCHSINYADYGGRGIQVCKRWFDYAHFLADIGEIKTGMSIERIDVNGNYEPQNCTVIPRSEQVHNRRKTVKVIVDGKPMALALACKQLGVSYSAAIQRARRGLSNDEILFKGRLCAS